MSRTAKVIALICWIIPVSAPIAPCHRYNTGGGALNQDLSLAKLRYYRTVSTRQHGLGHGCRVLGFGPMKYACKLSVLAYNLGNLWCEIQNNVRTLAEVWLGQS